MANEHAAISGRIHLLTVIGDPIAHAQSPTIINSVIGQRGISKDFVMVPMHVSADALATAIAGLRATQNFRGAIITMPHKGAILNLIDDVAPEAKQVGACNVIRRDKDGRIKGTMFDGEGFVAGLRAAGFEVTGKRCFMAGAGGAAAGIAFALGKYGASVLTIHNRTESKAVELSARVKAAYPKIEIEAGQNNPSGYDLVINATPLGMRAEDLIPINADKIDAGVHVAEVVIQPDITPLLERARQRGCQIHLGLPMLAAQINLMIEFMIQ
jgi:shikimate dehydrogenase